MSVRYKIFLLLLFFCRVVTLPTSGKAILDRVEVSDDWPRSNDVSEDSSAAVVDVSSSGETLKTVMDAPGFVHTEKPILAKDENTLNKAEYEVFAMLLLIILALLITIGVFISTRKTPRRTPTANQIALQEYASSVLGQIQIAAGGIGSR